MPHAQKPSHLKGLGLPLAPLDFYTLRRLWVLMQVHFFLSFLFADGEARQMELDPLMLTILGVVAGVLIVIIIVTLAIRIHASR